MKITVPNIITSIRFVAIPFMAYYIYASVNISDKYNTIAFILFVAIWATDVLDGYIARNFNQVSDFGKLFDPFVDKLFQFVTALMMAIVHKLPFWVPVIIFFKELLMIIGGTVLFKKYRLVVYSKWYGKLATVLFVLAFCVLFFLPKDMVSKSGLLFIPPIVISFFAYIKYCFDNVIPVIYRRSKRYLDSEAINNVIESEKQIPTSQRDSILFKKRKNKRHLFKKIRNYKRVNSEVKKQSYKIVKNLGKKQKGKVL
jgi:cardiolipin synthase